MADIGSLEFPPVTKVLLISAAAVTLPCLLQITSYARFYLGWERVVSNYEIWRPITNFLWIGPGGFPLLFDTFCLFQTSSALEKDHFGDSAAYVWMCTVIASLLLFFNYVSQLNTPFLFKPFLTALLYLWTKSNPTLNISVFGLVQVPARLYPLVLIFLDLVQGGTNRALGGVMGLMAGHLWWFLATYLPTQAPVHLRRANPLGMPPWFRRQFATRSNVTGSSGASTGRATAVGGVQVTAPRDDNAAAQVRHRWGSGNKLGGTGL